MTLKLLLYLLFIASAIGTWLGFVWQNGPHTAAVGHPVSGMALRQGRRFFMEDRTVVETSVLPGGAGCNDVKYTFAAVYDGHEGSAASNMLQQQLHHAVWAAAASSWRSSCSMYTKHFQTALIATAQQLNNAFLRKAQQAQEQTQGFGNQTYLELPQDSSNAISDQHGAPEVNSSSAANNGTDGWSSGTTAAVGTAAWDGDDGSTAVFAILAGRQLLIGNVGNSRAILCTNRTSSSATHLTNQSSQPASSRSGSLAVQQHTNKAAAAASNSPHHNSLRTGTGKVITPYTATVAADSSSQPSAGPIISTSGSTSSSSSVGTCHARSGSPLWYDPPAQPLVAIPLSADHTPARGDEAARITAAGGQVFANRATPNGKLRVRGELEVTRSFGDLGYQADGVIATPEFTAYDLQQGDAFVVLASDGMFEVLTSEEVCQHAWGVWSSNSSIRTTAPPPPALALSGQVAASSISQEPGQPSDPAGAAAHDTVAALQGCCDCTPQQKLLEAARLAGLDSRVVVQRQKRQRRSPSIQMEQQYMQEAATAAAVPDRHDGVTIVSNELPGQSPEVNHAYETAPDPAGKELVPHPQSILQQQQQQRQQRQQLQIFEQIGLVGHISGLVGHISTREPDNQCSELINQCSSTDVDHHTGDICPGVDANDLDGEPIYEHSVADRSYEYCTHPINITSPYTLPQAVALRLVSEAYNRMSMDNLAVVVLDVRALTAVTLPTAASAHDSRLHMIERSAAWCAGKFSAMAATLHGWVTTLSNAMKPTQLLKPDNSLAKMGQNVLTSVVDTLRSLGQGPASTRGVADLASSGAMSQSSPAPTCLGSHCDELPVSGNPSGFGVSLMADIEILRGLDVLLPACGVHELIETSHGLFVGPRGVWPSGVRGAGRDGDTGMLQEADVLHHVAAGNVQDVQSIRGAAVSHVTDGHLQLQAQRMNKLTSDGVLGTAIVCEGAPVASKHADAVPNDVETDRLHNYKLVNQLTSFVRLEADHLHLHPVLGVDELPVAPSQLVEAHKKHEGNVSSALGDLPMLSVSRHVLPMSLFSDNVRLGDANQVKPDSAQQSKQVQAVATAQQYCQALLQDKVLRQSVSAPFRAAVIGAGAGEVGSVRPVTDDAEAFLSTCLVGTAADPGVVVTQGGQGLSAVVEALAALPLQGVVDAVNVGQGGESEVGALSQKSESVLHDRLLEPAWGSMTWESHKALPHQQAESANHGLGPLVKAGLLLMATSRPGRALLGRHLGPNHAVHHHENLHTEVADAVEDSPSTSTSWQEQHIVDSISSLSSVVLQSDVDGRYKLGRAAGRGHFGEVWLATRLGGSLSHVHRGGVLQGKSATHGKAGHTTIEGPASDDMLVLKRVSGTSSESVRRSALREAYFGRVLEKHRRMLVLQASKEHSSRDDQHADDATAYAPRVALNASALLAGHDHLVRFVEGFTSMPEGDVWLVFQNEGRSLHDLLYEAPSVGCSANPSNDQKPRSQGPCNDQQGLSLVGPSNWWMNIRASADGNLFVASMVQQLLQGLEALHAANISHRDIKPENLLVSSISSKNHNAGHPASQIDPLSLHLRLIDFGSAVDMPSIRAGLYGYRGRAQDEGVAGQEGPSIDEVTMEYAPPEVLFSSRYRHPLAAGASQLHAFDIWSAGVVMLELSLGTPSVFTPSPATRAAIDRQLHLRGRSHEERRLLYVLRGLMEMCIYPPRAKSTPSMQQQAPRKPINQQQSTAHNDMTGGAALPIPWSCSDEALLDLLSNKDPQGVGLEGGLGVRLLQRLLAWEPTQRPTAAQALQHAYFLAADHMRATGSTVASEYYQQMLVQCSRLSAGEVGWC